jgi:hypothetical protein
MLTGSAEDARARTVGADRPRAVRPVLAWRIGVTGARALAADAVPALTAAAEQVLRLIRDEIAGLARDPLVAGTYDRAPPLLRLLSPLAEGADRLVAEAGLSLGYRLEAPLPFAADEYRKDFEDRPGSVAEFEALLGRAEQRLELDGGRGDDEDDSYEAVGRHVVANTDLVIAVWNGRQAAGRGGTGDIVRFALQTGVPVWWMPVSGDRPPRLLRDLRDLRERRQPPAGAAAERTLRALLGRAVRPPPPVAVHSHSVLGRGALLWSRPARRAVAPLRDYYDESLRPPGWMPPAYACFIDLIAPAPSAARPALLAPRDAPETYWHTAYDPADALSQAYVERYRSSYVLIFALAFLAIIGAVTALVSHAAALFCVIAEVVLLTTIAALVIANHRYSWHERWIGYRLLSELCRKQQALAPLGWSLPNWEIDRIAPRHADDPDDPADLPRDTWVAWYFTALRRAAPLPQGRFGATVLDHARAVGLSLIAEQLAYHRQRRRRSAVAARRLGNWGEWLFIATWIGVVAKLVLLASGGDHVAATALGWAGAVLPAAAAAALGIRAYAEFELLAEQSARMEAVMRAVETDLKRVPIDRPLASQELGETLYTAAIAMLQDIAGWAQLFRGKPVETS